MHHKQETQQASTGENIFNMVILKTAVFNIL